MRVMLSVMVVGVCFAGAALAQTSPPGKGKAQPGTAKEAGTDAFASCVSQWEKATHMSKVEWERACRRVANRLQNLTVK
jgi:hypothetical protein